MERYRRDDTDMYKKDKKLIMLELPLQYKRVINRFLNQGELETLLYLQLLMETGIRSADVWQIRAKDICGRKVFAQNRKYGEGLYYFNGNRLPLISKRTERIAQILAERHIPCNMINCFCMYSDYTPLTLDEWIACDERRRGNGEDVAVQINPHIIT